MLNVWLTLRSTTGKLMETGPWPMSKDQQLAVKEPDGRVPLNLLYMGRVGDTHLFELTLTGKKRSRQFVRVVNRQEIWNPNGTLLAIVEVSTGERWWERERVVVFSDDEANHPG